MSEEIQDNQNEQADSVSPGKKLRQARESSGYSQQALADKLFLKLTIIQQLEADELSPNTSITFTKGYVRLYSKNVGLEPEQMIAEFETFHKAGNPQQKLHSFSKRVSKEANDDRWMMVTYFILAAVVALVVVWWYQQPASRDTNAMQIPDITLSATSDSQNTSSSNQNENIRMSENATIEANSDSTALSSETLAAIAQNGGNQIAEPDQSGLSYEVSEEKASAVTQEEPLNTIERQGSEMMGSDTSQTDMVDGSETNVDSNAVMEETETSVEPEPEPVNEGPVLSTLVFTFADDCWVRVRDATGEAIAYGVKVAGRVMPVSGYAPFEVTLGAPHVVSITIDGEEVDMSDIPAGQSARFSVPRQDI